MKKLKKILINSRKDRALKTDSSYVLLAIQESNLFSTSTKKTFLNLSRHTVKQNENVKSLSADGLIKFPFSVFSGFSTFKALFKPNFLALGFKQNNKIIISQEHLNLIQKSFVSYSNISLFKQTFFVSRIITLAFFESSIKI